MIAVSAMTRMTAAPAMTEAAKTAAAEYAKKDRSPRAPMPRMSPPTPSVGSRPTLRLPLSKFDICLRLSSYRSDGTSTGIRGYLIASRVFEDDVMQEIIDGWEIPRPPGNGDVARSTMPDVPGARTRDLR